MQELLLPYHCKVTDTEFSFGTLKLKIKSVDCTAIYNATVFNFSIPREKFPIDTEAFAFYSHIILMIQKYISVYLQQERELPLFGDLQSAPSQTGKRKQGYKQFKFNIILSNMTHFEAHGSQIPSY